jgi:glutamate/tyrosine decarboxylase-like PLP-dependent enzyme
MKKIPQHGIEHQEALKQLAAFAAGDANYRESKIWSLVYDLGEAHTSFLREAYGLYFCENALNPLAFKSLKRMETEVVQMTAGLLNGDDRVSGVMTSGGTESCLLPVFACRERARKLRRLPFKPEMIAPETIHVAWEKAAKYFDVKMVRAPVDENFCADAKAMERLINRNTILLLASAPSYPHGAIDPIPDLGELALRYNLPLHVDACLGGFLLPFVERLGHRITPFDFRVPGVTSIGSDLHKYGFSAKGASVLLYRSVDDLMHQFFIYENWPGGIFASPALLGTRPGGAIAAAWGALNAIGMDGYLKIARTIMETTGRLTGAIGAIDGMSVLGRPAMSVFAYTSTNPDLDIYAVADQLEERGWWIDRLQRPAAIHCMVMPRHADVAEDYLNDLKAAVDIVRGNPGLAARGNAAMYGMIAHVPLRGMVKSKVAEMMAGLYGPACKMPAMADDSGSTSPLMDKFVRMGLKFLKHRPGSKR